MRKVRRVAPGKLVVAGEYAVLRAGGLGVVAAAGVGVEACVEEASRFSLRAPVLGASALEFAWGEAGPRWGRVLTEGETKGLRFVTGSLEQADNILKEKGIVPKPFLMTLAPWGDPRGPEAAWQASLGMGSSAASTVASLRAVLAFHGVAGEAELVRRASSRVHWQAQGGAGSGIDVAASSLGGLLRFEQEADGPQGGIGAQVTPLPCPVGWMWRAVWMGRSVETTPRLAIFNKFCLREPGQVTVFEAASRESVLALMRALEGEDFGLAREALGAQRRALIELGRSLGLEMEPAGLGTLVETLGPRAVMKVSGAGGGDCALLLLADEAAEAEARRKLEGAGLKVLEVALPISLSETEGW